MAFLFRPGLSHSWREKLSYNSLYTRCRFLLLLNYGTRIGITFQFLYSFLRPSHCILPPIQENFLLSRFQGSTFQGSAFRGSKVHGFFLLPGNFESFYWFYQFNQLVWLISRTAGTNRTNLTNGTSQFSWNPGTLEP